MTLTHQLTEKMAGVELPKPTPRPAKEEKANTLRKATAPTATATASKMENWERNVLCLLRWHDIEQQGLSRR
jgi:ribosomal protein S10